jgi:hypothetical protein
MNKDFCIVVFSHADNKEKEEILFNSLTSIKKLNLKVILASHIAVSERNQNMCDYFIKDDNNLIISESDIFNNPIDIDTDLFYTTDYFGGIKLETYVYKKSYQAGVFNLYISAFKLAKQIGFKNAILWEYDYELGDKSVDFFNKNMDIMIKDNLDSISFQSSIVFFNSDIIQSQIDCCYAIPVLFNLDKFLSKSPNKFIENGKEYTEVSKLMIMEQWVKSNIINNCNGLEYGYGDYKSYLPDTKIGQVHSQGNNYLFLGLRSGIYFSDKNCISSYNNVSKNKLNISLSIFDNSNNNIVFQENIDIYQDTWRYNYINDIIFNMFRTESGCRITEVVTDIDTNKSDTFEYVINKNNIDFVSKLKKFSISQ